MTDRRRRLSDSQMAVARVLGPLDGAQIAGGCEDCDAFQTVEPISSGVWSIVVHHDDGCPTLLAMRRGSA